MSEEPHLVIEADAMRAAVFLRARLGRVAPRLAVVLGSGLGSVASTLTDARRVGFAEIPGMRPVRVAGHGGVIHAGKWGRCPVLVFEGRLHLYEGHPEATVTLAVRTVAAMGARALILTNASGACDATIVPGTLMLVDDLIDLTFRRRAGGMPPALPGGAAVGATAGASSAPAPAPLRSAPALDFAITGLLDETARAESIPLEHGALCAWLGPSYETASEVRLAGRLGARAATMSTIAEAVAARQAGLPTAAVSMVCNYATGVVPAGTPGDRLDHAEVLASGARAADILGRLLQAFAGRL